MFNLITTIFILSIFIMTFILVLASIVNSIFDRYINKKYNERSTQFKDLYQRVLFIAGNVKNTDKWFITPFQALNYRTPAELISKGKIDIVEGLINEWESGLAL